MIDLLLSPDQLEPFLVIHATCALHAIAGTIYAERVASVRSGKCPGCGELFEIQKQKTKTYCDKKSCREKMKKRRQRGKLKP